MLSKSVIPYLALAIGIFSFRHMNTFYRSVFFQHLFSMLFYVISIQVINEMLLKGQKPNNHWVYNLGVPFELGCLTFGASSYFRKKENKWLCILPLIIFLIVYVTEICYKGFFTYSNYSVSLESLIVIVLYGIILYKEFAEDGGLPWYYSPTIWICMGLFIYFCCSLPYISLFEYLQIHFTGGNRFLFRIINSFTSNFYYLTLVVAFWLIRFNALKKTVAA